MAYPRCPRWLGHLLAHPLRRLLQNPHALLQPLISEGMAVLEPGPGTGFFTLELARLVGSRGRLVAIDAQPRILERLARKVARTGLAERIEIRQAQGDRLGSDDLEGTMDFVFAFAVVHDLVDQAAFFAETARTLKSGAQMLVAEPRSRVTTQDFGRILALANQAGLSVGYEPIIRFSHAALMRKR
jgi:ubiquinone/menaquinone biosynthesis C-methylase UbiE